MRKRIGQLKMSEKDMRGKVIKALKSLDAFAVENSCLPGTPDVNYIEGWLELKWLRSWPSGNDTIVRLEHYSKEQRLFHRVRERKGGNMHLLLQCGRTWMLFDGNTAAKYVGKCTKQELYEHCKMFWDRGLDEEDFLEWIRTDKEWK